MRTFGSPQTAASRDGSVNLPRTLLARGSSRSLLVDILLLSALAIAAGALRTSLRLHLRIPSHSILQWLPLVILGQLWVGRFWAGLYQGTVVGAICCFYPGRIMLSFGALAPFSEYLLAGGVVSWAFYRLSKPASLGWKLWLICPAVGLMANISRWVYRLAYYLPFPQRSLHYHGLLTCTILYASFGLCAGLVAALVYKLIRAKSAMHSEPSVN